MARNLTSIPDIQAPNAEYPVGRIQNEDPPIVGTPVIEELYGDQIQFFHKLMRLAGLAYSGLPDSETNGFDFITALNTYVRSLSGNTTTKGTWESATDAEFKAGVLIDRVVTPSNMAARDAGVLKKLIPFSWNMQTDIGRNIAHGLTLSKIVGVNVLIRNVADTLRTPLNYDLGGTGASGNFSVTATEVQMLRTSTGIFNSADYSTGAIRGYIKIDYLY